MDISKIKGGSLQLDKQDFQFNQLISDIIEDVSHTEPDCCITFYSGEEQVITADRDRVGQVLINLLTNAIKYSPGCNVVHVRSFIKDKMIAVSVQDFGIGINKNDQEKIIEQQNEKIHELENAINSHQQWIMKPSSAYENFYPRSDKTLIIRPLSHLTPKGSGRGAHGRQLNRGPSAPTHSVTKFYCACLKLVKADRAQSDLGFDGRPPKPRKPGCQALLSRRGQSERERGLKAS